MPHRVCVSRRCAESLGVGGQCVQGRSHALHCAGIAVEGCCVPRTNPSLFSIHHPPPPTPHPPPRPTQTHLTRAHCALPYAPHAGVLMSGGGCGGRGVLDSSCGPRRMTMKAPLQLRRKRKTCRRRRGRARVRCTLPPLACMHAVVHTQCLLSGCLGIGGRARMRRPSARACITHHPSPTLYSPLPHVYMHTKPKYTHAHSALGRRVGTRSTTSLPRHAVLCVCGCAVHASGGSVLLSVNVGSRKRAAKASALDFKLGGGPTTPSSGGLSAV
jgi:hypothetical protein